LVLRIATGLAEHQLRYAYIQQAQALQGVTLTQHSGAPKRMKPTTVDMTGLALAVEQTPIGARYPLHTTFTATTTIGLFDPLALLAPEIIKSLFGSYFTTW